MCQHIFDHFENITVFLYITYEFKLRNIRVDFVPYIQQSFASRNFCKNTFVSRNCIINGLYWMCCNNLHQMFNIFSTISNSFKDKIYETIVNYYQKFIGRKLLSDSQIFQCIRIMLCMLQNIMK